MWAADSMLLTVLMLAIAAITDTSFADIARGTDMYKIVRNVNITKNLEHRTLETKEGELYECFSWFIMNEFMAGVENFVIS